LKPNEIMDVWVRQATLMLNLKIDRMMTAPPGEVTMVKGQPSKPKKPPLVSDYVTRAEWGSCVSCPYPGEKPVALVMVGGGYEAEPNEYCLVHLREVAADIASACAQLEAEAK